jgi:peptidoglycan/LPS O-acetylase OafA/YrhL
VTRTPALEPVSGDDTVRTTEGGSAEQSAARAATTSEMRITNPAAATAAVLQSTASDLPSAAKHRRYASLDLLRALAIVLVVHCHSASGFAEPPLSTVLKLGGKGVELFFVLSGWLLGRQLVLELERTGKIELLRFWARRWMRTLPAYYGVLVVISMYILTRNGQPLRPEYLFFGQTYLAGMPYFGISWSLCVEEHFYLLVAPTLLLFWRRPGLRWLIPLLMIVPTICRVYGWYGAEYQTHVWYDACAMGVLLAAASVKYRKQWDRLRPLAAWVAAATLLIVVRDVAFAWRPEWRPAGGLLGPNPGILVYALVFAVWVWAAAVHPNWIAGRIPGVRYLAERSYAIYLLHLEVIAAIRHLPPMPFIVTLGLVWIGSIAVAEVLFRLVERPGMDLRDRFASTRSTSPGI